MSVLKARDGERSGQGSLAPRAVQLRFHQYRLATARNSRRNRPGCDERCSCKRTRSRGAAADVASGLEDPFGETEEGAEGTPHPADKQNDDQDEDGGDSGGGVGVASGEPGKRDGDDIFAEGEADVGEGFRRGCDGGTDSGLASVGGEGDGCTEEGGNELFLRRERGGGAPCDESGDRYADEGMERVPDEIEGGDFVGEELDGEEGGAGSYYPPTGEEMKRVGQNEDTAVGEQAKGS